MEQAHSLPGSPGSPGSAPLQPMSVNQQREAAPLFSPTRAEQRDSDIHDKIRQFDTLGRINTMSMSKQLERKTADAALKRAMLGREEAENMMRQYREEARALRKKVEEGHERERRVGERLETVMVGGASRQLGFRFDPLFPLTNHYIFTGELWASQGDTFPYSGIMGEGDPTSTQRSI